MEMLPKAKRLKTAPDVLHEALVDGNHDLVKQLLADGADPNAAKKSTILSLPIHMTVLKNNISALRLLLAANVDINAVAGEHELTALQLAAHLKRRGIVGELIRAGAELPPNRVQPLGTKPLGTKPKGMSCDQNSATNALRKMLTKWKRTKETFLHEYCSCGSIKQEVIERLVRFGVDVNEVNFNNETALHVFFGSTISRTGLSLDMKTPQTLMNLGANLNLRNSDGNTPFKVAFSSGYRLHALMDIFTRTKKPVDALSERHVDENARNEEALCSAPEKLRRRVEEVSSETGRIVHVSIFQVPTLLILAFRACLAIQRAAPKAPKQEEYIEKFSWINSTNNQEEARIWWMENVGDDDEDDGALEETEMSQQLPEEQSNENLITSPGISSHLLEESLHTKDDTTQERSDVVENQRDHQVPVLEENAAEGRDNNSIQYPSLGLYVTPPHSPRTVKEGPELELHEGTDASDSSAAEAEASIVDQGAKEIDRQLNSEESTTCNLPVQSPFVASPSPSPSPHSPCPPPSLSSVTPTTSDPLESQVKITMVPLTIGVETVIELYGKSSLTRTLAVTSSTEKEAERRGCSDAKVLEDQLTSSQDDDSNVTILCVSVDIFKKKGNLSLEIEKEAESQVSNEMENVTEEEKEEEGRDEPLTRENQSDDKTTPLLTSPALSDDFLEKVEEKTTHGGSCVVQSEDEGMTKEENEDSSASTESKELTEELNLSSQESQVKEDVQSEEPEEAVSVSSQDETNRSEPMEFVGETLTDEETEIETEDETEIENETEIESEVEYEAEKKLQKMCEIVKDREREENVETGSEDEAENDLRISDQVTEGSVLFVPPKACEELNKSIQERDVTEDVSFGPKDIEEEPTASADFGHKDITEEEEKSNNNLETPSIEPKDLKVMIREQKQDFDLHAEALRKLAESINQMKRNFGLKCDKKREKKQDNGEKETTKRQTRSQNKNMETPRDWRQR